MTYTVVRPIAETTLASATTTIDFASIPAGAPELASVLLARAEDCERPDAVALLRLDAYLGAVEGFDPTSRPND
jgi:hypothetical protein